MPSLLLSGSCANSAPIHSRSPLLLCHSSGQQKYAAALLCSVSAHQLTLIGWKIN